MNERRPGRLSRRCDLLLLFALCCLAGLCGAGPANAQAEANAGCTVSILNQSAFVKEDGTWSIPNVPSNLGPVRARITCLANGQTVSGSSSIFSIATNRESAIEPIALGGAAPTPVKIAVVAPTSSLTAVGQTVQVAVTATFPGGSTQDVTAAAAGTIYQSTNPKVATVSSDGLVSAVSSGRVLITAFNEAVLGGFLFTVTLSADSDGDGIPDDIELANGLDPNNPADALADLDGDGLTNFQELMVFGSDIRKADTDGDGLSDGDEVSLYHTNPLLADSDGDGLRDGLEIQTGSDPNDANSYNLAQALRAIEVAPPTFLLTVNVILGEASRQLSVTGHLIDGFDLDLTPATRGTNFDSNNPGVCNFGSENGKVFAGADGTCTITASNSGFSAQSIGTVRSFTPTALSFLAIPGYANNVDVSGRYAYVAAGEAGLVVVDVANPRVPVIVGTVDTPGNADDVKVVGNLAYVADGPSGLQIVDVSNPAAPVILGAVDTPGDAQDVAVHGNLALVADGPGGVQVIDVSAPAHPVLIRTVPPPAGSFSFDARGVDFESDRAVVVGGVDGSSDFFGVIDLRGGSNAVLVGQVRNFGDLRDVVLRDRFAYVADTFNSLVTIDLVDPAHPVVRSATGVGSTGRLMDVALAGGIAFAADFFFTNDVPVIGLVDPASPLPIAFIDFSGFRQDGGSGIAADAKYVYLTAGQNFSDNQVSGDSRLYIGQYLDTEDTAGVPPTVSITSPPAGTSAIGSSHLPVTVQAADDVGVAAVDLLVDGQIVATDTFAPYNFNVGIPVGVSSISLGARAVDFGGNITLAQEVQVTVTPNQPPVVAITSPAPGFSAVETSTVLISVSASDDVAVAAVDLLVNGQVVDTLTAAPYDFSFVLPQGASTLTLGARATDVGGLTTLAPEVQVTVTANQPPSLSIVSPAPGTTVVERASLRVTAQADDDLGVASVDFFANGSPVGTATEPPFSVVFSVPAGVTDLALGATATDVLGSQTSAAVVHLIVIPDPGTTAIGRVLDADGNPLVGADVRCVGVQGLSAAGGNFSIANVPTVQGLVQCIAFSGTNLSGRSAAVPAVPGGTTDVGDLFLGQQPLFPAPRTPVGDQPVSIVAGDFDGDGVPDLATANSQSNDLSVLRGVGDGTFRAEQRLAAGNFPRALVTTDVNGDGKLDLVSASGFDGFSTVSVRLGHGDGTFGTPATFPTGSGPSALVTADFNHDGHPDLATANAGNGYGGFEDVSVLLGNGDGTFSSPQSVMAGAQPVALATGDFNGDGTIDLVVANGSGDDLSILLGTGSGAFQPEVRFGTSLQGVSAVTVADVDGDGRADVVAAVTSQSQVAVFLGKGDGTFQPAVLYDTGSGPISVSAIDLNRDGHPDLVTRNSFSDDVSVLLNSGTGEFLAEKRFDPGQTITALAVTDLNRDRAPDFVAAVRRSSVVVADETAGSQKASRTPRTSFGSSWDLVAFLGAGDGSPVTFGTTQLSGPPQAVVVGDLDHDGVLDVVTANNGGGGGGGATSIATKGAISGPSASVSVLLGRGDGSFKTEARVDAGEQPRSVALADFDHDGNQDLAIANAAGYGGFSDVSILLGNGNGTFRPRLSVPAGSAPWQVKAADLNGDGIFDLLVPDGDNSVVNVLLGNGDGTFSQQPAAGVGLSPVAVALGDFNHDGALDFVAANKNSQDLSLVLGNGDGTFQTEVRLPLDSSPASVSSADLNGDGHQDLAVPAGSGGVLVLLGNGDGTFQPPVAYNPGFQAVDVAVADVDRDTKLDLVVANRDSVDVAVLAGAGDGTFGSPQRFSSLSGPTALAVGDLDRDGAPDVVVAHHDRQSLSILTRSGGSVAGDGPPPAAGLVVRGKRRASLDGPACKLQPGREAWLQALAKPAALWLAERSRSAIRAMTPVPAPAAARAAGAGRR